MNRKKISFLIGPIISLIAIFYILHKIDFNKLKESFLNVKLEWIIVLVIVYLSGFIFRGLRWQIMLKPIKPISWINSTSIIIIGYMANNVLPARLGEIVRAVIAYKKENIKMTSALASIFVERIFDGLILLAFFSIITTTGHFSKNVQLVIDTINLWASIIFLMGLLVIILIRLFRNLFLHFANKLAGFMPDSVRSKIESFCLSIVDAVTFLKIDFRFLVFVLLGFVIWTIEGSMFWVGLKAFKIPADFRLAYFTMTMINFGILIPSAPGYVGLFQAFNIIAFSAFGLNKELALSYSIVVHMLQYIPVSLIGLVLLNFLGIKLKNLQRLKY